MIAQPGELMGDYPKENLIRMVFNPAACNATLPETTMDVDESKHIGVSCFFQILPSLSQ